MKLATNPFTHAIAAGEKQIGIWSSLANGFAAEVIASAGFDWALLDMEHTPSDYFALLGQLQAFAASNTTAIVRPEWNDPVVVKRLLDLGGGPGTYSIHFCLANPEMEAVIFDRPTTKPFAFKTVASFDLEERIEFIGGDFNVDPIQGGPYDVAWLSHILHSNSYEDCQKCIEKTVAALEPGGLILIMDMFRPQSKNAARHIINTYASTEPEILQNDFYNSLLASFRVDEVREQLIQTGLDLHCE